MSLERNGREYADFVLLGDNGDDFFAKPPIEKALDLAWSDGCPVAIRLTKEPSEGGRGAMEMAKRYGRVNFWVGQIKDILVSHNRYDLVDQLTLKRERRSEEIMEDHDKGWIPNELKSQILVTPTAYSLPRILLAYIDQGKTIEQKQDRSIFVLNTLDNTSDDWLNITEFMVSVTNTLAENGGDTAVLLKNMFSHGKISEDNCMEEYEKTLKMMKKTAHELYRAYIDIPDEVKKKMGMEIVRI